MPRRTMALLITLTLSFLVTALVATAQPQAHVYKVSPLVPTDRWFLLRYCGNPKMIWPISRRHGSSTSTPTANIIFLLIKPLSDKDSGHYGLPEGHTPNRAEGVGDAL